MITTKEEKKRLQELSNSSNIISKGTIVDGSIEAFGNIRIEGKILGNVKSKSKIVISESAIIEGAILAQNAEIAGDVKGNIEVAELLILKSTAQVNGDIITHRLAIESGATFNGNCKMGAKVKEITIGEIKQA